MEQICLGHESGGFVTDLLAMPCDLGLCRGRVGWRWDGSWYVILDFLTYLCWRVLSRRRRFGGILALGAIFQYQVHSLLNSHPVILGSNYCSGLVYTAVEL